MKKNTAIIITIIAVLVLATLFSQASFTSSITSLAQINSGNLQLTMKLEDIPESEISGLMTGDRSWIPGDHREALCTIKNEGNLPARWRLGVIASGTPDPDVVDNIIFTWYQGEPANGWKLVKSQRLKDLLSTTGEERWLYDKDLFTNAIFQPLATAGKQQLVLQVDFELSAQALLQNKAFQGTILLEGGPVTGEQWFPATTVPLTVEGEKT